MNILVLSSWFPYPLNNGSKIRIYNLIKVLSKKYEIRLISFVRESEHVETEGFNGICRLEATIPWHTFAPHSWKSLFGIFSPTPRSVIDTYSPRMARQVQQSIVQERPDLIIASEMDSAIYGGRKWNIPCILDEMQLGLLAQVWSNSSSPFTKLRKKLYWAKARGYIKYLINQYNACIVASENEQELFSHLFDGQRCVNVVPNGVDLDFNRPGTVLPQPSTLIYNGALTFDANFDAMRYFLKEIFPLVRSHVPDTKLKITGSTQGVDLSQLNLDDHVILSGFLPDIRPAVSEARVCIVPLRLGGGTRLKILEAMALGTPVVATQKAAEGLRVTSGENILLADSPEEFSRQTVRLLKDDHLRDELAKNGRALVENNYGWDTIGSLFEQIIERVLNN